MKSIIFDSGPVISLTVNNLLWILEDLKKSYGGEFFMPESVRKEIIDRPIESKKFKLEALQVLNYVRQGIFVVHKADDKLKKLTLELLSLANSCYVCQKNNVTLIHYPEMEVIAFAILSGAEAVVVDERMMRAIVEDPHSVAKIMSRRLGRKVDLNKKKIEKFKAAVKGVKVIRSVELATIAYEKGLLDNLIARRSDVRKPRKVLLQGYLWALKLRGCAISQDEIDKLVRLELEKK